eukprot:COSAG05_NODE_16282_length_349_cov_0.956000_1_plen_28_part_10
MALGGGAGRRKGGAHGAHAPPGDPTRHR